MVDSRLQFATSDKFAMWIFVSQGAKHAGLTHAASIKKAISTTIPRCVLCTAHAVARVMPVTCGLCMHAVFQPRVMAVQHSKQLTRHMIKYQGGTPTPRTPHRLCTDCFAGSPGLTPRRRRAPTPRSQRLPAGDTASPWNSTDVAMPGYPLSVQWQREVRMLFPL